MKKHLMLFDMKCTSNKLTRPPEFTWEEEEQRGREKERRTVQIAGAEIAHIPEGTELACPRPPAAHSDVCFGTSPWI